jgi:exo beta-1,2-glucooligosaccharide sophorohydrolase (non-reducing end)
MLRKRLLACFVFISLAATAQEYQYNYSFFTNSSMAGNYFFSAAGSTGNSSIKNINNKLPVSEAIFHTPGNAL